MLSENEVKDIIDGKTVMAPLRQIQEVKNAIKTDELYEKLNPFDVNDLLKAHGTICLLYTSLYWSNIQRNHLQLSSSF